MRIILLSLILMLVIAEVSAIEPFRRGIDEISERKCNGSPSIKCLYLTGAVESDYLAKPIHTMTMPISDKRIKLMLPPVELGFFCLFELHLEKKYKLPVNFELK